MHPVSGRYLALMVVEGRINDVLPSLFTIQSDGDGGYWAMHLGRPVVHEESEWRALLACYALAGIPIINDTKNPRLLLGDID